MAVKMGSARHDENGKLRGGAAGDQTGSEVAIESWYRSSLGWYVLRAKDPKVAEKIAIAMERACANNCIGYDQGQNQTLWNIVKTLGFDPGKVATKCETDCSQLVRVCCEYAGIKVPMFSTADEVKILMATGAFELLKESKYCDKSDFLRRGDIVVTRAKGHTCVILTDGPESYKLDAALTKKMQKWLGTVADGEIWNQYKPNKVYFPTATTAWKWTTSVSRTGSPAIKALQKKLGTTADGLAGKNTATAFMKFLKAQGQTIASTEVSAGKFGLTATKALYNFLY